MYLVTWYFDNFRVPVQTIFDTSPNGGVVAMAMTSDARYLATLSAGPTQVMRNFEKLIKLLYTKIEYCKHGN